MATKQDSGTTEIPLDNEVYFAPTLEPIFLKAIEYIPTHLASGVLPQSRRSPKRRFIRGYHVTTPKGWRPARVRGYVKRRVQARKQRQARLAAQE